MQDVNKVANEARKSLSKYCMEECKSYCCRKGYIILKPTELDLVIGDKKDKLMEEESLRELSFSENIHLIYQIHLGVAHN